MKGTIYIAGKVTGVPHQERTEKFKHAEDALIKQGWRTINPLRLVKNPNEEWHTAMEICIAHLSLADAIYMLPCSVDSPGAKLELQTAIELNKDIYYELENVEANGTI
ncbi:DUF4406 domain-containing protein [Flavobacterium sp.]